jgi:signal transduction histidine kinase
LVGIAWEGTAVRFGGMSTSVAPVTRAGVDDSQVRSRRSRRDWLADAGFFLVAIVAGAIVVPLLGAAGDRASGSLQLADLALGVVASLAVFLRRRWPLGLALALLPVNVVSGASSGACAVALLTVAILRPFRVVAPVGLLYVATGMLFTAARLASPDPLWFDLLVSFAVNVLIYAAIMGWGMMIRARRQLVESLRERATRAEAEQRLRVEQARHLERERIAREMHDVLAHRISLLSLHAGALEFRPDAPIEEVSRAAAIIRQNAHEALQDLRRVIWILREPPTHQTPQPPQPRLADLPALVEDSNQAGVRVRVDNRLGDLTAVPPGLGRDGYRIVQEALTNARKHAPGCAVQLFVEGAEGSGLTIEVSNRLPVSSSAGPAIPGTGTGIVGLTERVTLAGGHLEHGPTPDGCFRLWAWLPWTA